MSGLSTMTLEAMMHLDTDQITTALNQRLHDTMKVKNNLAATASDGSLNEVNRQGRGAIQTLMGLEAASTGSLRGVMMGMRGLGNMLGEIGMKVGLVGGAFAAGWQIGTLSIREILHGQEFMDHLAETMEHVVEITEKSGEALRRFREARGDAERAAANPMPKIIKSQAEHEQEAAKAEQMDAGPARENAAAQARWHLENDRIDAEEARLNEQMSKLNQRKAEIANKEGEQYQTKKRELDKEMQDLQAKIDTVETQRDTALIKLDAALRDIKPEKTEESKKEKEEKVSIPQEKERRSMLDIATDRLSRIGGIMGATSASEHAKKTATATERMAKKMDQLYEVLKARQSGQAVYAQ